MLRIFPLRPAVAALNWTDSGGLGAADALRSYAAAGGMGGCFQDCCLFGLPLTVYGGGTWMSSPLWSASGGCLGPLTCVARVSTSDPQWQPVWGLKRGAPKRKPTATLIVCPPYRGWGKKLTGLPTRLQIPLLRRLADGHFLAFPDNDKTTLDPGAQQTQLSLSPIVNMPGMSMPMFRCHHHNSPLQCP